MIAIINASPLIYLSKIGVIDILPKLFKRIITTKTVKQEVLREKTAPENVILIEVFSDWLEVLEVDENIPKKIAALQVHTGEAEVIALGRSFVEKENATVVIIDDLLAREIATSLGLTVTGTIGVLLKGLNENIITKKKCLVLVEQLVTTTTFRLAADVYVRIIREIENMKK